MSILKLKPSCKDYLWGGHRLVEEYGKEYDGDVLAETWELSCHPDGPSVIVNGIHAGKTLQQYIDGQGRKVLGTNCARFRDFPILIKFIDAKDNLSIQVHPDNRYALKNEGQYGKTEMWYVMDAGEDAFLYYGFEKEISKEEFEKRIQEDTLLEVLHAVPVHKGDVLFIESGTIHAIGKDILIAEIQQNSNVTYRVYDYGRVGKDGKKRELHVDKAVAVTKRAPVVKDSSAYPHVADCDYFTVDKLDLDGAVKKKMAGVVGQGSFASILVLDGQGIISNDGETIAYKKGDSFFIPAGSGAYEIEGVCDALVTTIRKKADTIRIGIDIGGTDTKIGLVDEENCLIAKTVIPTKAIRPADEVIADIGSAALNLLENEGIAMDRCTGAGIGMPGVIDRKNGIVCYSNNISWGNVELAKEIGKYLPIPIQVANDADCAALGETLAGAGKDYKDVLLLTLGTGVGSGLVIDGKICEGRGIGSSEAGHMVIVDNGELCTCGRKGCLETYASATALVRGARRVAHKELKPEEIFAGAAFGDTRMLGTGIVNLVNIFHPQLVLLGGGLSAQKETLLAPLREILLSQSFGGTKAQIPELEIAKLGNEAGMIGAAGLLP